MEITLSDDEVWDVLEAIGTGVNQKNGKEVISFIQVSSGIRVEWNPDGGNGSGLVNVTVGDEPLKRDRDYDVVTMGFPAGGKSTLRLCCAWEIRLILKTGGDTFLEPTTSFPSLNTQDELLVTYIESQSPVDIQLESCMVESNGQSGALGNDITGSTSGAEHKTAAAEALESAAVRLPSIRALIAGGLTALGPVAS